MAERAFCLRTAGAFGYGEFFEFFGGLFLVMGERVAVLDQRWV